MQGGAVDQFCWGGAVEGVAKNGEAESIGMDTDLVRAPGSGSRGKERIATETLQDLEMSFGGGAFGVVHNRAVAVAYVHDPDTGGEVDVLPAFDVRDGRVSRAGHVDRRGSGDAARDGEDAAPVRVRWLLAAGAAAAVLLGSGTALATLRIALVGLDPQGPVAARLTL